MSRKQWIGLVIVLIMVTAVETCVYMTNKYRVAHPAPELLVMQPEREQAFLLYLDSVEMAEQEARRTAYASRYPKPDIFLQPFDPNTADSTLLVTIGLRPWMAKNLIRYRNAGKIFRQPEDIRKLYGMTDSLYATLAPYIQIDTTFLDTLSEDYRGYSGVNTTYDYPKRDTILDLNTADTTELMLLRGVGHYTATHIIRYRHELGGYYSTHQLYEIPQIPSQRVDSLLPFLFVDTTNIIPINVNHASVKGLYRHPYISYPQAEQVYDLRRRKLRLSTLNELSAIFTPDELQRLAPYLSFDQAD